MARKKQEVQLQVEVETQEEWEEMLAKEGVTVVDVYQDWSGPCKAMISNFRRFKNELGDDLLRFAIAKADTVDALERYRGKCQPCFLFFAGGVLVDVVRGANCPQIQRMVVDQLAKEHKVLDGSAERKEIKDPLLASGGEKDVGGDEEEDEEGSDDGSKKLSSVSTHDINEVCTKLSSTSFHGKKGVSVAIIKPDLVAAGKVDEVIDKMKEHGIEILEREERQLSPEDAKEFYSHLAEEEFFEKLIEFMSSGPSVVLVITKGDTGDTIIEEWRELLGPKKVEEAKDQAPDSLRAQYGTEELQNALHGSDSNESAMRELAFFFPGFNVPSLPSTKPKAGKSAASEPKIQRTLALIRPEALAEKKDEILAKIAESGFTIAMSKEMHLTKEQAEEFYSEHKEQEYFEELTTRMSNAPLLALALAREDAVDAWRDKLGPKMPEEAKEQAPESLRAQFSVEGCPINTLHGSDSTDTAQKELEYFFGPVEQTIAVIKPEAYQTQDEIMKTIKEAGFHIAAKKQTELTKEIAAEFYKEHQDKEYFDDLTTHMSSGPTLFMVLSRENAVEGWRSIIGPTDPEQAKEAAPESLRAKLGQDVKANAVHGSSTADHAKESIKLVFGDVEFSSDAENGGGIAEAASAQAPAPETGNEVLAPAAEETSEQAPASDEQAPVTESEAPAADEQAPAAEEQPAPEEQAPVAEEQTQEQEQSPEAVETTEEQTQEAAPEAEEAAPAPEESTPAPDEGAIPDEQAPAIESAEDSSAPVEEAEATEQSAAETPAGEAAADEQKPVEE